MAGSANRPVDEAGDWVDWCADWFGVRARRGDRPDGPAQARIDDLGRRFEAIGWGLFFLFLAALALPSGTAEYVSVAVVGGLLVALNVARVATGVPVQWFGLIAGMSMLVGGGAAVAGVRIDLLVLLFGLAGLFTIAAAFRRPGHHRVA